MQEIFFTILVVWILFRIFQPRTGGQGNINIHHHYNSGSHHEPESDIEGNSNKVKIEKSKKGSEPFSDFEELK
jgi:hypothetical protein